MRRGILAWIMLVLLQSVTWAQATPQRMVGDAEAPQWYGLARLNIAGNRYCNAVLVSSREVVTAAHCLFHPLTHHFADARDIKVVFGQRRGAYVALRGVTARVVLPGYVPGTAGHASIADIARDVALLRLDKPVPADVARPFPVADWRAREIVTITGYGRDRPYIPSLRDGCTLIPVAPSIAKLDCVVVPGLSGSPVTVPAADGKGRDVVGLVSALIDERTGVKTGDALVVRLAPQLEKLRALLPGPSPGN